MMCMFNQTFINYLVHLEEKILGKMSPVQDAFSISLKPKDVRKNEVSRDTDRQIDRNRA